MSEKSKVALHSIPSNFAFLRHIDPTHRLGSRLDFTSPSYPPLDPIGRQGTKNTKTAVKAIKTRFSSNFFDFPHRKPKKGFFYHSGGGHFSQQGRSLKCPATIPLCTVGWQNLLESLPTSTVARVIWFA